MRAHRHRCWSRWSGGWCRRIWWSWQPRWSLGGGGMHLTGGKHAHHCCLHFMVGLHELCIGCNKVVDCCILLDQCFGQVFKQCGDLVCLVLLLSCVGAKCSLARCHAVDVAHFGKGCRPMGFPVGPGVVGDASTVPLVPCHSHVATRKCVPCPSGDHGGLRDGYCRVKCKHLATFLLPCVDSQGLVRVDPCVEVGQVVVKVGLAYLCVRSCNVVDKRA
jgi:hypothetical protein